LDEEQQSRDGRQGFHHRGDQRHPDRRLFPESPGIDSRVYPHIKDDQNKWEKEDEIVKPTQDQLGPLRETYNDEVNRYVATVEKRIGCQNHEMSSVENIDHIVGPDVR